MLLGFVSIMNLLLGACPPTSVPMLPVLAPFANPPPSAYPPTWATALPALTLTESPLLSVYLPTGATALSVTAPIGNPLPSTYPSAGATMLLVLTLIRNPLKGAYPCPLVVGTPRNPGLLQHTYMPYMPTILLYAPVLRVALFPTVAVGYIK